MTAFLGGGRPLVLLVALAATGCGSAARSSPVRSGHDPLRPAARAAPRAVALPVALSDATAVALGGTAYVIGGYTTTTPLRSVLAFRPGRAPREVARLPHPLRYAAAAVADGRILVAGGTDGTTARDEVLSVDPVRHRARVVGRLPVRLAHAAGAALGGTFYVLGGRGDALDGQRAAIWAVDPRTGRV